MSFIISIGRYGGFYFYNGYTKRICLGWIAFTFIPDDIDNVLKRLIYLKPKAMNTSSNNFFVSVDNTAPVLLDELIKANTAADVEPISASDIQKIRELRVGESLWVGICEIKRVAPNSKN